MQGNNRMLKLHHKSNLKVLLHSTKKLKQPKLIIVGMIPETTHSTQTAKMFPPFLDWAT